MTTTLLSRDALVAAVETAVRAPSVHNTQPWRFRILADGVEVHADQSRRLAVADPTGRALRVSCGAAIFNLRLALHQYGYEPTVHLVGAPDLLARIHTGQPRPPTPAETRLYEAIPRRQSNRYPFTDKAIPSDVRFALTAAAKVEGCWLDLILSPAGFAMVAELVGAADRILLTDEAYRAELAAWTRQGDHHADGVSRHAGGPAPEPQDLLVRRDFGGPPRAPGHDFETDPLVGVFGGPAGAPTDDLIAGQALQRVLLTATGLGLATSLMSQPIDVPRIREQLRIGLRRYGEPQLLVRFGYGLPASATPRRAVTDVLLPDDL